MAFIPEVKCGRCDRRYSALRMKCPYCGTYKRRRTRKIADTGNGTWRGVVVCALLLVMCVAVVVLASDAKKEQAQLDAAVKLEQEKQEDAALEKTIDSAVAGADEYVTAKQEALAESGEGEQEGENPDEQQGEALPDIQIESVKLYNADTSKELAVANSSEYDYDISVPIGYSYTMSYTVVPDSMTPQVQGQAVWESSDTGVLAVLQSGKITGISKGTAYLYCKVAGAEAKAIVRVS